MRKIWIVVAAVVVLSVGFLAGAAQPRRPAAFQPRNMPLRVQTCTIVDQDGNEVGFAVESGGGRVWVIKTGDGYSAVALPK